MEVYDCSYCHDEYVESHRQSCPSTPRGTCVAVADWEYWNHDYPYCDYCHDDYDHDYYGYYYNYV